MAKRINPAQAGAWASLSHLYNNDPTTTSSHVIDAAQRAYEADAFLSNASTIVERLFYTSYDLDQLVDAARWCAEGQKRFPSESAFTICQLYLMTMRGQDPRPDSAWRLAQSPLITDEYQKAEARMMTAGVLARALLRDSAKAVARGAVLSPELDPTRDLYLQQSFVYLLADDKPAAIAALRTYLTANPERRAAFATDPGWRLRSLMSDQAFTDLVGAR
jgi:serine/threonine-protein kinase